MDSVALILDVEEVRRHRQPYNGNEIIYGELPCHEVGGFGHFRHSSLLPTRVLSEGLADHLGSCDNRRGLRSSLLP